MIFSKRILSIASALACLGTLSAEENIMPNGGMELDSNNSGKPDKWDYRNIPTSQVKYAIDSKEKQTGRQSVKLTFDAARTTSDEGYLVFRDKKMEVFQAGKKYKLSLFCKTAKFKGAVSLSANFSKDKENLGNANKKIEFGSDSDWQKIEVEFTVPKDTGTVTVFTDTTGGIGGGEVWFDNIQLSEIFTTEQAAAVPPAPSAAAPAAEKKAEAKAEAVTEFKENFAEGKLSSDFWQGTKSGIELDKGLINISTDGQILSKKVFPQGSLEFRITISTPLTFGNVGWGLREKFGAKPRITFSIEESMALRASISNDNGKPITFEIGALDTKEHLYRIDWNEKEIKFFLDGKEVFKSELPDGFIISPRPVTIYNVDSDAVAKITAINYKSSLPADKVAEVQSKLKFVLERDMDVKFKKVIHADETPLPQVPEFWAERKYIVFARPYIQHCFLQDTPEADEILDISKGLKIFLTPGEYEPLTFAVHALDEIKEYRAKMTDLISKDNKTISQENIQVGTVKNLNKRFLYQAKWSTDYMLFPTFIEAKDQVDIEKGTNKQFWFTVNVPENASPGIYTGMIEFASIYGPEGGIPTEIPVTIEILPFKLEEPRNHSFGFWHPTSLSRYTKESLTNDFKEMRKHGMNTIFGSGGGISSQKEVSVKGDKIEFNLGKDSKFLWMLDAYKDAGFYQKVLYATDNARSWANSKVNNEFTPEWNAEYVKYMKAFNEMLRKNNYPAFIYQPIDEVGWLTEYLRESFFNLVKLLKEAGAETEIDGPFDKYMAETALQYSDVLNINGGLTTLEKIKELKAKGKTIWAYNNDVEAIRPETMRFSAGYWLWISNTDGINNWAYNHKSGADIYDDLSGVTANFVYFYPKTKTEIGGPALAFEAFREGIDDLRYLLTWAKAVKKLKDSGMAAEAEASEKTIGTLMEKIKYTDRIRDKAVFPKTYYKADGQKVVAGDFKIPNQLSYKDYDQLRYTIAKETEKLLTLKK